jgi:hypothetical protein
MLIQQITPFEFGSVFLTSTGIRPWREKKKKEKYETDKQKRHNKKERLTVPASR